MEIKCYPMGPLGTNSYFLFEEDEVILIDPAGKSEKVEELLEGHKLVAILLTHGHFDHTKAVDGLYKKYNVPIYLHPGDEELVRDKQQGKEFNIFSYVKSPIVCLKESTMAISHFKFEVIFTPGHTEGSVIYVFGEDIFTGDTLFKGSVGRTDLPGGNNSKLMASLNVFYKFAKECHVYPGHGESSTIGYELENNPFL